MEELKLSYSSATLLRGCQQRFYNYKTNVEKDSDFEDNSSALTIGTCFHSILENSMHQKPERMGLELERCVNELHLDPEQTGLLHAMTLKYLRLHKQSGLECIKCEIEIGDKYTLGFVDAILKDPKTNQWWIVDLKTCRTFYKNIIPKLKRDVQLNLYSYFAPQIAKELKLKVKDFAGVRYRTTTKSVAKQKKNETYISYVERLIGLVKTYDIIIPKEHLDPKGVYQSHIVDYTNAVDILQGNKVPMKNFSYCDSYFKPCPYFSKCHGKEFSCNSEGITIDEL